MSKEQMTATASQIARAIKVTPRTKKFELRDSMGIRMQGRRSELILGALGNYADPALPAGLHTVAYALFKSITTGRMNPTVAMAICDMTPYQVCGIVARVARECPETTTGGICDTWLPEHQHDLIAA